ncbi:MAG TPA: hypothetical protein VNN80_19180, partial [Polyangiaceae bacterium]|nr:hypothetical protein [Polyangiaceae bacterium]
MRKTLLPMLLVAGCVGSGAAETAPPAHFVSAAPAAKSAAGGRPASLAPGEVLELGVSPDGGATALLETPSGRERFIIIIASTRFDAERTPVSYAFELGAASEPSSSSAVSGCSLDASRWASVPVGNDAPPSGEGPTLGATRSI